MKRVVVYSPFDNAIFRNYNDAKLELPSLTDSINLEPFENALGVVKVNSIAASESEAIQAC